MIFPALTVRQPYASAMFFGPHPKDDENRSKKPPEKLIGQRLWIHAGEAFERCGLALCRRMGFNPLGYEGKVPGYVAERIQAANPVPHGVILGSVLLDGYVVGNAGWTVGSVHSRRLESPWRDPSVEYGWILRDPQPLLVPIPVPQGGQLTHGWRLPEDVAVQIVAQERGEMRAA
jgi:hypothetical protein